MHVAQTVFWSWQSDLDSRVTREVIRYALDQAIGILAADLQEADRPSLTSDTQGVAGTPDIVATILRKIDETAVFVGDVTPIAVSPSGKACANPNVLLELGYANKAIGDTRVIQVWNTAFNGAAVEKLPFDMRGRRGPLAFHLPVDSDTAALRAVRDKLARDLAGALRLAFDGLPPAPIEPVHWQASTGLLDIWFDPASPIPVNHPQHGTTDICLVPANRGYARVIPSHWHASANAKAQITATTGHPALLGDAKRLGFGTCRHGAMTYRPEPEEGPVRQVGALTQWFEKAGEFWGIENGFLYEDDGYRFVATEYAVREWFAFLKRNCALALELGGALPIHLRLGVTGLHGTWWPSEGRFAFEGRTFAAVEPSLEFSATIFSTDADALVSVVAQAFNALRAVYGKPPIAPQDIVGLGEHA